MSDNTTGQTEGNADTLRAEGDRLPDVYALIWRSHTADDEPDQEGFERRLPQLMEWLRSLREQDVLLACGGGGFENNAGGLTLVRADSPEHAMELAAGNPMNEIGSTELLIWDVYFADLVWRRHEARLRGRS